MSCFIYQIMAPEKVYQLQLTLSENDDKKSQRQKFH